MPEGVGRYRMRYISIPPADDEAMEQLANQYNCSVAEVYRRATALYILTQSRIDTFDVWPGEAPDDPPHVAWSQEGGVNHVEGS